MLYVLTIKKSHSQKPHPTLLAIRRYLSTVGKNDFLICWPGHLSGSVGTANNFHQNFPLKLTSSTAKQPHCYFFNGFNGTDNMPTTNLTKAEFINNLYNGYYSTFCPKTDHSKIIVFCNSRKYISKKSRSLDSFIRKIIDKQIKVKAILIGSSNQSDNTYTKRTIDSKGECDVFLLDEDLFKDDVGAITFYNSLIETIKGNKESSSFVSLAKELRTNWDLNDIFNTLIK